LLPFFFASFLAFGVVLVLPGVHQAELARALSLDLSRSGLLASALSAGLGVGVVGAGPLFDRLRRRPLFVASLGIAAAALLSVRAEMPFARWLLHVAATGLGIGAYDTLINASVAERYRERAARPMSLVHAAATLGAMSGPLLAVWLDARGGFVASFHALGAAHLALAAWALLVAFPDPVRRESDMTQSGVDSTSASSAVACAVLPFAAVGFAYVGVETSLTMFAVPYAGAHGLPETRGGSAISAFWLGLLAGRLGVLALPVALGTRTICAAGALGAAALLGGVSLRIGVVEATFLATGMALGCVYPLMIALVGQRVPDARGLAAGLAAGAAAAGGAAVPWLTGSLGDALGVSGALASLAGWCAVIAGAAALARGVRQAGAP
jgi:fucose permease